MTEWNSDMNDWEVGDRVLIKAHGSWLQPVRKYTEERRPGTITKLPRGPGIFSNTYFVTFDVRRKGAKPHVVEVGESELIPLPPPPAGE